MSNSTNGCCKTAEVAKNVINTLDIIQPTPSVRPKTEAEMQATIRAASGQAPALGENASAKSGGNDLFSGIARVITSAVNAAMTVINPANAVAIAADTMIKTINKKA